MSSQFSFCELNKQKAIRYHHNFGDFDFLLVQADDGSINIDYYCSENITLLSKQSIGASAVQHLAVTAEALSYKIKSDTLTFNDAVNILNSAIKFLNK